MVWSSVNRTIIVNPNIGMVKPQRKIFAQKRRCCRGHAICYTTEKAFDFFKKGNFFNFSFFLFNLYKVKQHKRYPNTARS